MIQAYGYASNHSFTGLKHQTFERDEVNPNNPLTRSFNFILSTVPENTN